jgi:hypothetical protein
MARIRTIKPDFWTDEKVTECSVSARLFFIGCWNFADDNGNLQRSAKKLKMQIFPADSIECEPLIQELSTHGLLIEYSVNSEKFLHINGFNKHQIINRPSKTGLPKPNFNECSRNNHAPLTEPSRTEGKGIGEDKKERTSSDVPKKSRFDDFWAAYPSRGGAANPKKPAMEKFDKLVRAGDPPEQIILGASNYAVERRSSGSDGTEFVMQATKFLNQRVWEGFQAPVAQRSPTFDLGETPF